MNLSGFPSLIAARIYSCDLTSLSVVNTQPIILLDGHINLLSVAQVDSILIALDGNGLPGGLVDLSGQTPPAPPSAPGMAAVISLLGNGWTVIVDPGIFILSDGVGGFWQLIVDATGNVGTQATVGPAGSDIILDDGGGGFWKVVVDALGNRGATPDAGPSTLVPALDDGAGGFWKLIVDVTGNLGAQSI